MNYADKLKKLAIDYAVAFSDFSIHGTMQDDIDRYKAEEALNSAIDEMQAEIDRLRLTLQHEADCMAAAKDKIDRLKKDAVNEIASGGVLVRLGRVEEYEGVCDELVFVDAMVGCTWPDYELVKRGGDT